MTAPFISKAALLVAGIAAVGVGLAGPSAGATPQHQSAATAHPSADRPEAADDWAGCPDGAVCIYPQNQNPAVSPSQVFYSYGAHNLSNQFGNHWVLNNQTGGATASLCTGSGGAGCGAPIAAQAGVYADLTPINSITLNRP